MTQQVYRYAPDKLHRYALPALALVGGLALSVYCYFASANSDKQIEITAFLTGATLLFSLILYWRYTQVIEVLPDKVVFYRAGKVANEFLFDRCVFRAMMGDYKNPLAPGMDCTLVVRRDGQIGEKFPVYLPRAVFQELFAVITAMQLNYTGGVEPDGGRDPLPQAPEKAAAYAAGRKQIPARTFVVYPERAVALIYKTRLSNTWIMPAILGIAVGLLLHELPDAYAQPLPLAALGGVVVFALAAGIQYAITRSKVRFIIDAAPKKIHLDSQGIALDGKKIAFEDIKRVIATPATSSKDRLEPRLLKITLNSGETLDYCLGLRDDDEKEKTSTLPGYSDLLAALHRVFSDSPGAFMAHL